MVAEGILLLLAVRQPLETVIIPQALTADERDPR